MTGVATASLTSYGVSISPSPKASSFPSSGAPISRRSCFPSGISTKPGSVFREVAFKSTDSQTWKISAAVKLNESSTSTQDVEDKIGKRVRVKVPLKVYHIPKVPEVDLSDMEGEIKQYVGLWKGKRISANLPYKVEFISEIPGRGTVKFFAHLKEDEFDYI